jgi:DNA end-binding protein Ku
MWIRTIHSYIALPPWWNPTEFNYRLARLEGRLRFVPNAVWTGSLSFGLVNVPVRLIPATEPKDVRFHLYDRSGRRVRYERVVDEEPAWEPQRRSEEAAEPEPVQGWDAESQPPTAAVGETPEERVEPSGGGRIGWEDVVRGMETDTGDVVLLSREEIDRARPQRSRAIDVEDFVDLADIDPVFFEKTYYAIPQSLEAAKPYVLLHRTMQTTGRIGIGRFVLRTKPHLVAVRPMDDVLAVETLFFGDEVRDPSTLAPGLASLQVDERELDLAAKLVEMLKTEWDPSRYSDTYREELLRMLAEKAPTRRADEEVAAATPAEGGSAVEQLMTALKESVEQARAKQEKRPGSRKVG